MDIQAFRIGIDPIPDWFMDKVSENKVILRSNAPEDCHIEQRDEFKTYCEIITTDGVVTADYGDYIIKNEDGNFYYLKPDIFVKTVPYILGEFNTAKRMYC